MKLMCLDLEGVLVPEIWIAFAQATGIDELKLTTRDISDYNILMKKRIGILKAHRLTLNDIQKTIATLDPMEGAKEFLDTLRSQMQVIILSDTFTQFASPLMKKLAYPTIFCNSLEIDSNGMIGDYTMRQNEGKYHAVCALQKIGYEVYAAGDSFNDLAMIAQAQKGFLFRAPSHIINEHPQFSSYTEYAELLNAVL